MHTEPFHAELTMDTKGRILLPAPIRMALRTEGTNQLVAVANQGDRGGLSLFTRTHYQRVLDEKASAVDPFDPFSSTMLFLQSVVSTNHTLNIDTNGRVLVPGRLRDLADLTGQVFLFSMAGWFELWNMARWQDRHPGLVELWLDRVSTSPVAVTEEGE